MFLSRAQRTSDPPASLGTSLETHLSLVDLYDFTAQSGTQIARNLLDPADGFLRNASHLIHDRDPLFTQAWTGLLKSGGVNSVPIPSQSPNCNPYAERFMKTIRTECLDHLVIFGERHLRHLI
jgi:hypothetical protein